jgi:hypothetical protein
VQDRSHHCSCIIYISSASLLPRRILPLKQEIEPLHTRPDLVGRLQHH